MTADMEVGAPARTPTELAAAQATHSTLTIQRGAYEPDGSFQSLLKVLGFRDSERVALCSKPSPKGRFTSDLGTVRTAPHRARRVAHVDCWFGTAPLHPITKGRGTAADVAGIVCVFADLDFEPGKARDEATARAIIAGVSERLGSQPVGVIRSGHGLQPLWKLKRDATTTFNVGPDPRRDHAVVVLAGFGSLVSAVAAEHDATVDSVFELARILRTPNTTNRKDPTVPVTTSVEFPEGASALTLAQVGAARPAKLAPVAKAPAAASAPAAAKATPRQPRRLLAVRDDGELDPWAAAARGGELDRLDELAAVPWQPGARWDSGVHAVACNLIELSNTPSANYSRERAHDDFMAHAPRDDSWGADQHEQKWRSALATVGDKGRERTARPDAPDAGEKDDEDDKFSAAAVVIEHVTRRYDIGVTPSGEPFAVPRKGPRLPVMLGMKGGALRARVTADLYDGKRVLRAQAVDDGFRVILARAVASTTATVLHLRVAHLGERVVIDLGQPGSAQCVDIGPDGWKVLDNPPAGVLFQRTSATRPIPTPTRGGSLEPLRELLGFASTDPRWTLIRGWLVAQFFAGIPRPLLLFLGPPGVAKTSHARQVVSVLDPREELGSNFGKAISDDQVKALSRYLVSYDNLASVSEVVSDHLCRLVSGDEIDKRKLFSDGELVTITYRRTGVMTAVTLPGLRADALERVITLGLDRIPEGQRRTESVLRAEFAQAHPAILGGLCDALSTTLARLPAVRASKGHRPRWADFHEVLSAYDPHCASAYLDSLTESMADAADADPFVVAVCAWLTSVGGAWKGAPQDAWGQADHHRKTQPGGFDTAQWWPRGGPQFSAALVRATEPLRAKGIAVERRRADGRRILSLTTVTP